MANPLELAHMPRILKKKTAQTTHRRRGERTVKVNAILAASLSSKAINYSTITIRPHEALNGKTPSEACGITIEGQNKWLTLIQNAIKQKNRC
jgi:hypothetical protein